MKNTYWAPIFLIGLSAAASATTFTETFDNGSNAGGWAFGSPFGGIQNDGGNPGAYWRDSGLDTFAPQPRTTTTDSLFTGDYRTLGVTSVGIDLLTSYVDFSADGRPLTVMLISDNDTPGNFNDDWAAYRIGPTNVPLVGQGWLSYSFDIPSDSTTLPAGWDTIRLGSGSPRRPDWNNVITDVNTLGYFYGDPTFFYIFQVWDVGLDNPSITYVPEPGSLALFAVAAVAAILKVRRS